MNQENENVSNMQSNVGPYTLYMKRPIQLIHEQIDITDESDKLYYHAEITPLSLSRETKLYNQKNDCVAVIIRSFFSLHYRHSVQMSDGMSFDLEREMFTLFNSNIRIPGLGWSLTGSLLDFSFTLSDRNGELIARIERKILSFNRRYVVEIYKQSQEARVIAVMVGLQDIARDMANSSGN